VSEPLEESATPPRTGPRARSAPTILIGANEDQRRLLRGLLLMFHRPIALEAPSLSAVPESATDSSARLLVFAAPPEGEGWSEELRGTLRAHPDLNALVLLPGDAPTSRSSATRAGAQMVLGRPFTSRDFRDALDRLELEAPSPAPASPPPPRVRSPAPARPR
jgi:hypothetical protein